MKGEKMARQTKTERLPAGARSQACTICGEGIATLVKVHQEFSYGSGEGARTVRALVPVWTCGTCELEYLDEAGEAAQHAAVCRELGRLTPEDIRSIRASAGLSQDAFAKKLKVGIASVKRWELGTVVQNEAADESIRRFAADARAPASRKPRFHTDFPQAVMNAAGRFRVRAAYGPQLAAG